MHQYIREQADALAQRRMGEYRQPLEWEGYEIPRQVPSYQGPYFRGGGPDERGPKSGQGPSRKETQKQKIPTKSGETGSAYPHSMGGIAPGGGGETPPPSRGGPRDDRRDDESDEEENEEDDTDEETVSVTSSSQVSANRVRPLVWGSSKESEKGSEGVPQRTQMILLEEEMLKMVVGDHKDIEVRGVGPDHLEEMEQWDQWDPLDQGDSLEGMGYPPLGVHSLPRG